MKIRAGFVSNSSSTSFLILTKEELNRDAFFELMGLEKHSPAAELFGQLYEDVRRCASTKVDLGEVPKDMPVERWFNDRRAGLSDRMKEKLVEARKKGLIAYFGYLDSETNPVQRRGRRSGRCPWMPSRCRPQFPEQRAVDVVGPDAT